MFLIPQKLLFLPFLMSSFALAKSSLKRVAQDTSLAAQGHWTKLRELEKQGVLFSAEVTHLGTGEDLGSYEGQQRLIPASVTKLVIGAAALEKLGADHAINTKLYYSGTRKGPTIHGDLVLDGSGDPGLTNEKIWFLASDVARMGITKVTGIFKINTSRFAPVPLDENRAAGKNYSTHAYDSPLSAAAVNYSVMAVVAGPGSFVGAPAHISLEPFKLPYLVVSGEVKTTALGKSALQVSRLKTAQTERITVSGQVPADSFPIRSYKSISDADQYAAEVYRAFLQEAGVKFGGKYVKETTPPDFSQLKPLSQVEGFPLDYHLKGLMQMSNNFIADMLTISLPAVDENTRGLELKKGTKILESFLSKVSENVNKGDYSSIGNSVFTDDIAFSKANENDTPQNYANKLVLHSGSGLTPQNRVSASEANALLRYMYHQPQTFPAFLAALPAPGTDSTLRKRFNTPSTQQLGTRLRAKTGTLTEPRDVVGLAGYVRLSDGQWASFAVIANGSATQPNPGTDRLRQAIDQDLASLFQNRVR